MAGEVSALSAAALLTVEETSRSVVKMLEQSNRLGALALLKKHLPTLGLGPRQQLVNSLQKELRQRQAIDLAELTAKLSPHCGATSVGAAIDAVQPPAPEVSTLHIFGDSHTHVLASLKCSSHALLAYPFVAGSAMGLRRADSRSGYGEVLDGDLRRVPRADAVIFKFGQVDIDFVYYLKLADAPTLSFVDFAADSVAKYMNYVLPALERHGLSRERFYLMTPNPTVVTDAHLRESLCTLPFMRADFKAGPRPI